MFVYRCMGWNHNQQPNQPSNRQPSQPKSRGTVADFKSFKVIDHIRQSAKKVVPLQKVEPVVVVEAETPVAVLKQATMPLIGCELVRNYAWDIATARAICLAESGGDANAANLNDKHYGCTGSFGLMQIACIHTGKVAEYDPIRNMDKAFEIYSRSGWKPWGAFTSGNY